jgi:hypothetical protein
MQVAHSVMGYVPNAELERLQAGKAYDSHFEIPIEAGKTEQLVRIRQADVDEIRTGPSRGGHTSVQLILKPGSSYQYVIKPDPEDFTPVFDPVLHSAARLPINVIFAPTQSVLRPNEIR